MSNKMGDTQIDYIGNELGLFAHARNWKSYFASRLRPYISGDVAEVGAGLGGTTQVLCTGSEQSWTSIEPDPRLCDEIAGKVTRNELPSIVKSSVSVLADRPLTDTFDSILYIDVLEHIQDDRREAEHAAARLNPGGHLVVLAPAHQALYTPFDKAIGHYRRYSKKSIRAISPPGLKLKACFYLDSVGLFASIANKVLLRQSHPKLGQILFWDRFMVPPSRIIDRILFGTLGKTLIAVWEKP